VSLPTQLNYYLDGHKKKDISVLGRLISLIESTNKNHQKIFSDFFQKIKIKHCPVIGVSGTPGAGKSTFINQIGLLFLKNNRQLKLAVIAVDPTSEISGGSILGDKTRMGELSSQKNVFIRPIASKGSFGGVTPRIELMIKALKAWSYDLIIIESVGVGQTESTIRSVADQLILLVPPGTGDDLQAMKRGLLEMIDVICINKIDLSSKELVDTTFEHYKNSTMILRSKAIPIFLTNSCTTQGLSKFYKWLELNMKKKSKVIQDHDTLKNLVYLELQQKFSDWFEKNEINKKNITINNTIIEFAKYLLKK
jgi:LAO/AO transport system kinase